MAESSFLFMPLIGSKPLGSFGPDPVALRLGKSRFSAVEEMQPTLLLDCSNEHLVRLRHLGFLSSFSATHSPASNKTACAMLGSSLKRSANCLVRRLRLQA